MTLTKSPALPVALLILAIISTQLGAALSKSLYAAVGAEGATVYRFGISAVILAVFFKPWKAKIDSTNWKTLLIYGAAMCGTCLFFYLSIRTIPLGIASTIEFTGPMAVALFSSRHRIDLLWIGLAAIGLLLLMPFRSAEAGLDITGVIYVILAAICWAIYIVAGQKAGALHGMRTTALGVLIATALVLPVGFSHAGVTLFDVALLPTGLALALLTSTIPFTLEMVALQRLSALAFGTLLSLEPAIACLIGFAFLKENLSLLQCIAIALIVAASIGITLSAGPKTPEVPVA
ncbi:MAG: EamA family transporter [Alphaproteobacteria bacterium]|nr:EamA family transporter [Alphaproteobacteria bacterium]